MYDEFEFQCIGSRDEPLRQKLLKNGTPAKQNRKKRNFFYLIS